jgi:cell division protein FtsB
MTAPARTRRRAAEKARADTPVRETPVPEARAREALAEERHQAVRRSAAAERAYARRAQRVEETKRPAPRPERGRGLRLRKPKSRASFVLLVMVLLAAGVATTLLLSTQAIADSYRLEQIRQENANLAERSQQLQQDVTKEGSASSLAERARALGMVPAGEPAHLVQNPDGSVTVVGDPQKVTAPPPPTSSTPPRGSTPGGDVPSGDQPPAGTGQ